MTTLRRQDFLTPEGLTELKALRSPGFDAPVTSDPAPIRLLSTLPSEECGCPEEVWMVQGLLYVIHFEADGTSDLICFGGEFEDERSVSADSMDALRAHIFTHFARLPIEGQANEQEIA